jgi:carbamate kinase
MGPKVEAAFRFAERTGRIALIGAIDQAVANLVGKARTVVHGILIDVCAPHL